MEQTDTEHMDTPPQDGEDAIPLTDREKEVLRLIAEGMTNAEIAEQLFLSHKTVKSHVSNILFKLRLPDRTQAAVFAYRQGLTGS